MCFNNLEANGRVIIKKTFRKQNLILIKNVQKITLQLLL